MRFGPENDRLTELCSESFFDGDDLPVSTDINHNARPPQIPLQQWPNARRKACLSRSICLKMFVRHADFGTRPVYGPSHISARAEVALYIYTYTIHIYGQPELSGRQCVGVRRSANTPAAVFVVVVVVVVVSSVVYETRSHVLHTHTHKLGRPLPHTGHRENTSPRRINRDRAEASAAAAVAGRVARCT